MQLVVFVIVSVQWHRNVFPDVDLCYSVTCSKGKHRSCAVACLVSDWFQCGVLLPSWNRRLGCWHMLETRHELTGTDKNSDS